jgi:uncharacterized phiE125 gp8 family phage protein
MVVKYRVVTQPVITPIEATDEVLKRHCNLDTTDTDEDALITTYIKSAVSQIEKYIGYPLMTQVVEIQIPERVEGKRYTIQEKQVLIGNVNDIVSYKYYNGTQDVEITGTEATSLTVEKYPILSYVRNESWGGGTRYRIKANVGYTALTVPDDIKDACRMLVMQKYENREGAVSMPEAVINILDLYYIP